MGKPDDVILERSLRMGYVWIIHQIKHVFVNTSVETFLETNRQTDRLTK